MLQSKTGRFDAILLLAFLIWFACGPFLIATLAARLIGSPGIASRQTYPNHNGRAGGGD